jgi:hypothetical protein
MLFVTFPVRFHGCTTLAFGDEPHPMLKVFHFGKHCGFNLQGECVLVGHFKKP